MSVTTFVTKGMKLNSTQDAEFFQRFDIAENLAFASALKPQA